MRNIYLRYRLRKDVRQYWKFWQKNPMPDGSNPVDMFEGRYYSSSECERVGGCFYGPVVYRGMCAAQYKDHYLERLIRNA